MPACPEGMELAQAFLISAGEGVNRLGTEGPGDRITELRAAYMALVEHGEDCDSCNEVDMNYTKDAMMPQSKIGKEPVPEAEGIEPLPETETERHRTAETYSEGGLSGEASFEWITQKRSAPLDVTLDTEPFMMRNHTDEEIADYDSGFACGQNGGHNDDTNSQAWQRGWAEAQE
jgi:hypothetical protein